MRTRLPAPPATDPPEPRPASAGRVSKDFYFSFGFACRQRFPPPPLPPPRAFWTVTPVVAASLSVPLLTMSATL